MSRPVRVALTGYVPPDMRAVVERIAKRDSQTLSEAVETLLAEAIGSRRRRGLLSEGGGKP